jgi:hypothetical protein
MSACATIVLPLNGRGPTEGETRFANRFAPFSSDSFCIKNARFEHIVKQPANVAIGPTSSGIFNTTLYAFAEEKPLLINPDDLYLHILQRVAEHVNLNSDSLKNKFVAQNAGKETIVVNNDALRQGNPDSPWHLCFALFRDALRQRVIGGIPTIDFTSTTPVAQVCQTIALMDMLQAYFNFEVHTRCGIPEIALGGTKEDWTLVLESTITLLKRVEMDWWLLQLQPILEHFASAARGEQADIGFWSSMVRLFPSQSGSGPTADGWITKLFPYLKLSDGSGVRRNPFIDNGWQSRIEFDSLPSSLSKVPFVWDYFGKRIKMFFIAGAIATQIDENGRLASIASYAVIYDDPIEEKSGGSSRAKRYPVQEYYDDNY